MKVLFCTNLPSPYRVDFFNELGKLCDLTVCYERKSSSERNSKWISKSSGTYTEEFLNLQPVGTDKSKGSALRKYVKTHRFDLFIFTNYVSEACMEAIVYCKLHHIPYCIEYDGGFNKTDPLPKKLLKQFLLKKAKAHLTTCDIHIEYLESMGLLAAHVASAELLGTGESCKEIHGQILRVILVSLGVGFGYLLQIGCVRHDNVHA